MSIDFRTFNDAEIRRWHHLRAIEWSAWPAFITQPVVPILFIFFPLLSVIVGLVIADFLWRFVRYSLIVPRLAQVGSLFVAFFKWPSVIGAAIYMFAHHRYGMATLAIFWPWLAAFVATPANLFAVAVGRPTLVGRIEIEFGKRVGYIPQDAVL